MRLSEVCAETGESAPTIKYYLRERLMPPGRSTGAPKRAEYGPEHLRRIRLIRTLTEVGGLPLATVRVVLAAIDDPALGVHDMLGTAHAGLSLTTTASAPGSDEALAEVEAYLDGLGWEIPPVQEPAKRALAAALTALRVLGMEVGPSVFDPYAKLVFGLAEHELATVPDEGPRERIVESVVIGTVVFEAALVALRRLAQSHHSGKRFAEAG